MRYRAKCSLFNLRRFCPWVVALAKKEQSSSPNSGPTASPRTNVMMMAARLLTVSCAAVDKMMPTQLKYRTLVHDSGGDPTNGQLSSINIYSNPIDVRFGEVVSSHTEGALPAKIAQQIGVASVEYDFVRRDATGETSVPISKISNHHAQLTFYGQNETSEIAVAMNVPAWARHSGPLTYEAPLRLPVRFAPRRFTLSSHVINTWRKDAPYDADASLRLAQCPCTPQRVFDSASGTIDGSDFYSSSKLSCHEALEREDNPVCSMHTYVGGSLCCREPANETFVIDTATECALPACADLPVERFFMKVTVRYDELLPSTLTLEGTVVPTIGPEFVVPACADGTAPDACTHTLSWESPVELDHRQPQGKEEEGAAPDEHEEGAAASSLPTDPGEATSTSSSSSSSTGEETCTAALVRASPHLHSSALSMELQDARTNATICHVSVANGRLVGGVGDEAGFLTGQRPCTWSADSAPRLAHGQMLRVNVVHNARALHGSPQMGLVAFWELGYVLSTPEGCAASPSTV